MRLDFIQTSFGWLSWTLLEQGKKLCYCQIGIEVQFPTQPPVRLERAFFSWGGVEFQAQHCSVQTLYYSVEVF